MKTSILLIGILLIFSCSNKSANQKDNRQNPTQIKVAAWNVEYGKNATATEIGEALKQFDFDIVCFSEAPGGKWTKDAGEAMGMNYFAMGRYSTAGHEDKYKTIVSKTLLYDIDEIQMADTLHTATKAKTKINNTEIAIYSVHFPFGWRDQAHIDETTNKILTFVNYLKSKKTEEIAVVAGDFNFIPSNPDSTSMYYEMFVETGMDVIWKELGIDCTKRNTWNAFEHEHNGNGEVIDHIIYNTLNMKVLDGEIVEMEKPLSDHKPVWALLQIK